MPVASHIECNCGLAGAQPTTEVRYGMLQDCAWETRCSTSRSRALRLSKYCTHLRDCPLYDIRNCSLRVDPDTVVMFDSTRSQECRDEPWLRAQMRLPENLHLVYSSVDESVLSKFLQLLACTSLSLDEARAISSRERRLNASAPGLHVVSAAICSGATRRRSRARARQHSAVHRLLENRSTW